MYSPHLGEISLPRNLPRQSGLSATSLSIRRARWQRRYLHTCKVSFSRDYASEYPTEPALLAQSLAAKSQECVQYQGGNSYQQQQQQHQQVLYNRQQQQQKQQTVTFTTWPASLFGSARHQPQQQQVVHTTTRAQRSTVSVSSGGSSSVTPQGWFGRVWKHNSSGTSHTSSSSSRGLWRAQAGAAATTEITRSGSAHLAADVAASTTSSTTTSSSSSSNVLISTVGANSTPNASALTSNSSSEEVCYMTQLYSSAIAVGAVPVNPNAAPAAGSDKQQQQHQLLDGAWNSTMSALAATAMTTEVAAAAAATDPPAAVPGSSGRSRVARSHAGSSSSSSSRDSYDEADWLTAVLSDSTSRLSVHSNAVLTNSLKRLASLRTLGGAAAVAAGAAVAAVDGSEGLAGLLESVRVRFGTFQLQHFEEVALQLAQLGYQPDADWLASFERHSLRVMPGGSPRLLSRLLLARAKLSGSCSSSWCSECLKHMTAQPERMTVSSWVNALWALVRMKQKPDRQFQTIFFRSSAERLDDVSPELLNNLLWSLGRLQLAPSYLWWKSLVQAAATIEKSFTHSQLASLIHSVSLWAEPGGIAPRDVQFFVDLLLVEVDVQLSVMQPAELTTIVWSLGSLTASGKLVPDWEIQARLLHAVQSQLPRLKPSQLSSLCWGLAKLDHGLPECFAEALLMEVQAQMQGFADASLANVMWALAKLELNPGAAFKQALWQDLHARLRSLPVHDMCTLLWALARLQLQPPTDLMHELLDQSLPQLRSCDPSQLANLTWALGRLQANPSLSWLTEFEEASVRILPSALLPDLVNLAWGRSELGQQRVSDGRFVGNPRPASVTWQAAMLRELRLRCRCLGHEMDCLQLVQVLKEMGVEGLSEGAAAAEASFWADSFTGDGCPVVFQQGCK